MKEFNLANKLKRMGYVQSYFNSNYFYKCINNVEIHIYISNNNIHEYFVNTGNYSLECDEDIFYHVASLNKAWYQLMEDIKKILKINKGVLNGHEE